MLQVLQWTIQRMRGEFEELPGLTVTVPEAVDRWGHDTDELQIVLDTLVDVRFLERSLDGAYARRRPIGEPAHIGTVEWGPEHSQKREQ